MPLLTIFQLYRGEILIEIYYKILYLFHYMLMIFPESCCLLYADSNHYLNPVLENMRSKHQRWTISYRRFILGAMKITPNYFKIYH